MSTERLRFIGHRGVFRKPPLAAVLDEQALSVLERLRLSNLVPIPLAELEAYESGSARMLVGCQNSVPPAKQPSGAGSPRLPYICAPIAEAIGREGMTKLVLYDEFGLPSSSHTFNLEPSVLLVLREQGRLAPHGPRPIVDALPWDTTTFPNNEPVVDVRGLRRLR